MVSLHAFLLAAALAGSHDTVLLEFTADWCGPCRLMQPTIQRLHDAGYPIRPVNVDREPDLTRQFRVGPIPCFVLIRGGREVDRLVGAASYDRLVRMFESPSQVGGVPTDPTAVPRDPGNMRAQSPDAPTAPLAPLPTVSSTAGEAEPRSLAATTHGADSSPVAPRSTIRQRALLATVRLCVRDATGQSHATGTIIDVHGDEALVLTCGHVFRASRGQGEILVELCMPGATGPVPGKLITYESETRDIGLVSIRPGIRVYPMRVAPTEYRLQKGESVFSVGCDYGASPTVRESAISAINRYAGAPNLEIVGHPVEGRSGGGLFTADGLLIGVCNGADLEEDRGLYASLPVIHNELRAINQERIFAGDPALPAAPVADARIVEPGVSAISLQGVTTPPAPSSPSDALEVICIVRSRHGADRDERVLVIDTPSADLLHQLRQAAQGAARDPAPGAPAPPILNAARQQPASIPPPPPILRAQNY